MRISKTGNGTLLMTSVALAAALAASGQALAGGFEVREQSTYFQGMSFAGAAAGGRSLSSVFWNPAASNYVGSGLTLESNYALILPQSETTITSLHPALGTCAARDCSVDIGRDAVVPASYMAYRISPQTVFALSINSQYGLSTQPDDRAWAGRIYNTAGSIFSVNAAPSLSHEILPGLSVGAGLQVQYFQLKKFQTTIPAALVGADTRTNLQGDDIDIGWTLGVNWKPTPSTSIGLGWRSAITHSVVGFAETSSIAGETATRIAADVDTPDKVTLSVIQDLAPNMRVAATAEWTQWSRLGIIPINNQATGASIGSSLDLQWDDGWYFALGGEYDYNDKLTLRLGGAYEISPISEPTQRILALPDADRIWASIGASYKWNATTTLDFAYSHVFVEDSTFSRAPGQDALAGIRSSGVAESSVDIVSVGLKTTWGGAAAPLK